MRMLRLLLKSLKIRENTCRLPSSFRAKYPTAINDPCIRRNNTQNGEAIFVDDE
jgi:hypothetical protein